MVALPLVACQGGANPPAGTPGTGPLRAELRGLLVAREPEVHILRALGSDGQLRAGESLMLRARLSRPAFLSLLAQRAGAAAEPIWPAVSALHDAGEFELDEGDRPLLIEPSQVRGGAALALVACPQAPDAGSLRTRLALADPGQAGRAFPRCTVAVLPLALANAGQP